MAGEVEPSWRWSAAAIALFISILGITWGGGSVTGSLRVRVESLENWQKDIIELAAQRAAMISQLQQFQQQAEAKFETFEQRRVDRERQLSELSTLLNQFREDISSLETQTAVTDNDITEIKNKLTSIVIAIQRLADEKGKPPRP